MHYQYMYKHINKTFIYSVKFHSLLLFTKETLYTLVSAVCNWEQTFISNVRMNMKSVYNWIIDTSLS